MLAVFVFLRGNGPAGNLIRVNNVGVWSPFFPKTSRSCGIPPFQVSGGTRPRRSAGVSRPVRPFLRSDWPWAQVTSSRRRFFLGFAPDVSAATNRNRVQTCKYQNDEFCSRCEASSSRANA